MPAPTSPHTLPTTPAAVTALAASHGLSLRADSVRLNEAGLDFRVAFADASDGAAWVLRMPRRPDVSAKLAEEQRILDFVAPRLAVDVPRWEICSAQLVAYRRLPGSPGLTLDADGQPVWHYDPTSPAFAAALGHLIAALHALDTHDAAAAGVPTTSMHAARTRWADHLKAAHAAFAIAPHLAARWEAWLSDDTLWPPLATLTHGELYAAHLLLDSPARIVGVLDWTTAKVGDPALDFVYQHMMGPDAFDATVQAYLSAGGTPLANLSARCAEITAAAPLTYATFALQTQDPQHLTTAAALLNPPTP